MVLSFMMLKALGILVLKFLKQNLAVSCPYILIVCVILYRCYYKKIIENIYCNRYYHQEITVLRVCRG
ncbi:hypothetical protein Sez_0704 [Streptococcus equi subsp. zooepidemicus MGCS10565]|uniref:Uncharacterized protein n=1 Tax=Streptococcus equi subsp. zooepidemicus (strain MGCS10565) TaxID=552526 RepID=B4U250_STREM|nr:hypothetical protein Sez_0704 [Streptococcus equi subsp. zooepidemicus MGCS10565]